MGEAIITINRINMKKGVILFLFLLFSGIINSQDSVDIKLDDFASSFVKSFNLYTDNDYFAGLLGARNSDEDFTTGIGALLTTEGWANKFLIFPQFKPNSHTHVRNHSGLGIELLYYTPRTLDTREVIEDERPYASFQFIRIVHRSDMRRINFHNIRNKYRKIHTELHVGVVGGGAARSLQDWQHRKDNSHAPRPLGWHNQIGADRYLLAANYNAFYQFSMWDTPIKKIQKSDRTFTTFQTHNIHLGIGLHAGMIDNRSYFEIIANFFNYNMHNEHYIQYSTVSDLDFPEGSFYVKPESFEPLIKRGKIKDDQITYATLLKEDDVKEDEVIFRQYKGEKQLKTPEEEINEKVIHDNRFRFRLFAKARFSFVAHNGFLQGVLTYPRTEEFLPHRIDLINPGVGRLELGFHLRPWLDVLAIEASLVFRTQEYPANQADGERDFISKDIHSWGRINIILYPGMFNGMELRRRIKKASKKYQQNTGSN